MAVFRTKGEGLFTGSRAPSQWLHHATNTVFLSNHQLVFSKPSGRGGAHKLSPLPWLSSSLHRSCAGDHSCLSSRMQQSCMAGSQGSTLLQPFLGSCALSDPSFAMFSKPGREWFRYPVQKDLFSGYTGNAGYSVLSSTVFFFPKR